jgi:hypothetical protein
MAFNDSRLGPGTLTLGTTDFGVQISNVSLIPSHATTDGTPTLGTPEPAAEATTTWALKGSAIQDWESAAGFVEYCRANNNVVVSYSWVPNTAKTVTYSGTCKVLAIEIGGDVNKQVTSDFEFSVVGSPTVTYGTASVPTVPLNIVAKAESATVVVVDWDAPVAGAPTSYDVYQSSTEGGVYTKVTTNITKTGTTARLSSLTTATTYWYKVTATNGTGESLKSAAASVTTP